MLLEEGETLTGYASEDNAHLAQYNPEQVAVAFEGLDQTADAFLFTHCKDRKGYATNFMGVRRTYEQLDAEIERVARALKGFGVNQGDFISICMPNLKETIVYMYACWRIGAVTNMIDPRTNGLGIVERVTRTNSKLLVTVMNICDPKIDEVLDALPLVVTVSPSDSLRPCRKLKATMGYFIYRRKKRQFAKGRMDGGSVGKYMWHTDFIRRYSFEGEIRAVYEPDMLAALLYTSGTSSDGVIKGAMHTHRALNAMPRAYQCSGMNDEHRKGYTFGGFIPFFSAYGIFGGMHVSLCAGLEILLVPVFDPHKFAELILRLKPNIFMSVPRSFEQLVHHPKLQKKSKRLSFVKVPASGGDKISPASLEKINQTFLRNGYAGGLRIGYGATEFGGSVSVMQSYDPAGSDIAWKAEGNVGYLLPHCRGMVLDPETLRELPYGQDGELCVHSRCMMRGYYGMPAETEEITFTAPDGTKYYRTGDKGHLDDQGIFYFVDRYKRSIMRPEGHTVHPSPIENVVMMHPAVESCAVVGLRQNAEMAGAIPSAFVVLRPGFETEAARQAILREIDALCLRHLPERDRAIAYKTVDALPYTLMGKVNFRELEKDLFDEKAFLITDFFFFPHLNAEQ